jgi:cytochrome c5
MFFFSYNHVLPTPAHKITMTSTQPRKPNPIAVAAGIAGASVALILAIFMLAQFAVRSYASRVVLTSPAMSAQAVAERLRPDGELKVDPNAPPPAPTEPSAAPAPTAAAPLPAAASSSAGTGEKSADTSANGKTVYESLCVSCHAAGVAGAPKAGDKAGWAPRIAQGKDALYASALKGKGVMPAKGGNPGLGDQDVKAAVDYLVSLAQ